MLYVFVDVPFVSSQVETHIVHATGVQLLQVIAKLVSTVLSSWAYVPLVMAMLWKDSPAQQAIMT